jgi:hypothetical protein
MCDSNYRLLGHFRCTDTGIAKEFGIFSEPTMFNHLQSIAKQNRYELLEFPEMDPAQ